MKNYALISLLAAGLLSGCATPPEEIHSQYISSVEYEDLSCPQISVEIARRNTRASELYTELDKVASDDEAQAAIGIIVFLPTLLFLEGGDDVRAEQYARLKGELDALESVALMKECDNVPAKWQAPSKAEN